MSDDTRDETGTSPGWLKGSRRDGASAGVPSLSIAWYHAEPGRLGERALLRARHVLGRGAPRPDDPAPRLAFAHDRPGPRKNPEPLTSKGLSRVQLHLEVKGDAVVVENVGRAGLRVNGRTETSAALRVGDVLTVEDQLVLYVGRAASGEVRRGLVDPGFRASEPDAFGLVGESEAAWRLRDEVAFAARRDLHVLVLGPSGVGKELVARALQALSSRKDAPFVARNAATLPSGLLDAELFGNAKNYPHAGLAERPGLVGEADGGTLFLDEIGELSEELSAHLLRLLDGGEYHRLGEARGRRADVRLVAATNRDVSTLKHDLAARLTLRLTVPGLDERRADVPAILRHLLLRRRERDPGLVEPILDPATGEPRVDPDLVEALLRYPFTTHVRELESIALTALARSRSAYLPLIDEVREKLAPARRDPPTVDEIREALAREGGSVTKAFRALGLPSRDALNRLVKKHGLRARD